MKYTESHNPRGEKTSKPQLCRGGDSGPPRVRVRATASWPCTLCLPMGILSGTCGVAPCPVCTPLGRTPTPPCCSVRSLSWAGTHTPALCAQNGSHSRNKHDKEVHSQTPCGSCCGWGVPCLPVLGQLKQECPGRTDGALPLKPCYSSPALWFSSLTPFQLLPGLPADTLQGHRDRFMEQFTK